MTFKLPRLNSTSAIADTATGKAIAYFTRLWDQAMTKIEGQFLVSGTGIVVADNSQTAKVRTLMAGTGLSVANGNGVSGNPTVSLSNTAVASGSYGDATHVPALTVNAQGQLTACVATPISFPVTSVFGRSGAVIATSGDYSFAQIGSKPTTLAGYGITDAVVTGVASSTNGNIATFNGTTGKAIQDSGKSLPTGSIVGTTDAQTLSAKTLTAPAMTDPTITGITTLSTTSVGLRGEPVNTQDADYTLALGDAGGTIKHTSSTGHAHTIPPNSSVAFPIGTKINFWNQGSGTETIARGAGVTLWMAGTGTDSNKSVAQWGYAKIVKVNTDTWVCSGTGVT